MPAIVAYYVEGVFAHRCPLIALLYVVFFTPVLIL